MGTNIETYASIVRFLPNLAALTVGGRVDMSSDVAMALEETRPPLRMLRVLGYVGTIKRLELLMNLLRLSVMRNLRGIEIIDLWRYEEDVRPMDLGRGWIDHIPSSVRAIRFCGPGVHPFALVVWMASPIRNRLAYLRCCLDGVLAPSDRGTIQPAPKVSAAYSRSMDWLTSAQALNPYCDFDLVEHDLSAARA